MSAAGRALCRVDEIGAAGKGVRVAGLDRSAPDRELDIFLVRWADQVRAYVNLCPHQGTRLDFKPDVFLDADRVFIQCTTHWARFRKHDGLCVKGPCVGRRLIGVPVTVAADGTVTAGGAVVRGRPLRE